MRLNIKKTIPIILLVLVIGCIAAYFFYNSEEQKARRAVEAHLKATKSGIGNPLETVSTKVGAVFINVLDYHYLVTSKKEKVPDAPLVLDQRMYDMALKKIYKSYDEFLSKMMKLYGAQATRDGDRIIVRLNSSHYEFEFLYDLVVTNALGQQLYKKYYFEVKPTSIGDYGYEITRFYER